MAEIKYRISAVDDTKQGTSSAENNFANLGANMAKTAAKIVAALATLKVVVDFGKDSVKAYMEQEKAVAKLNAAITATGKAGKISSANLVKYAESLQKITKFGDETTISAMGTLQMFGELDEMTIKNLTPHIMDMAEALGVDLEQAMMMTAKAINSPTNMLSRYGIQIDTAASKTEKISQLTEQLTKKFGGLADAMGNTTEGKLIRIKNAFGDMQEVLGKLIIDMAEPLMTGVGDFLNKNGGTISAIVGNLPQVIGIVAKGAQGMLRELLTGPGFAKIVTDMVSLLVVGLGAAAASFGTLLYESVANIIPGLVKLLTGMMARLGEKYFWKERLTKEQFEAVKPQYPELMGLKGSYSESPYGQYLKEFEKRNADMTKFMEEAYDKMGTGISNTVDAVVKNFEIFKNKLGSTAKSIGDTFIDTKAYQEMSKQLAELTKNAEAASKGVEKLNTGMYTYTNKVEEQAGAGAYAHGSPYGTVGTGTQNAPGFFETLFAEFNPLASIIKFGLQIENVSKLLKFFETFLNGVLSVLEGPINEALQPIIDLLTQLGQILGKFLLPVIKFLGAIIKGVATFIAMIFNGIATLINTIFGIFGVHINLIDIDSLGKGPTDDSEAMAAKQAHSSSGSSTYTGGGPAYTAAPVYNVTVNVYAGILEAGDKVMTTDDLCLFLRDRMAQLAEVGA